MSRMVPCLGLARTLADIILLMHTCSNILARTYVARKDSVHPLTMHTLSTQDDLTLRR